MKAKKPKGIRITLFFPGKSKWELLMNQTIPWGTCEECGRFFMFFHRCRREK